LGVEKHVFSGDYATYLDDRTYIFSSYLNVLRLFFIQNAAAKSIILLYGLIVALTCEWIPDLSMFVNLITSQHENAFTIRKSFANK